MWLWTHIHNFSIPNNAPLTDLIKELGAVVGQHFQPGGLDYDMVLRRVEAALARDDWPENDTALPFVMRDMRTNTVFRQDTEDSKTTKSKKHKAQSAQSQSMETEMSDGHRGSNFGDDELRSMGDEECEQCVEFDLFAEPPDESPPVLPTVNQEPPVDEDPEPKRKRGKPNGRSKALGARSATAASSSSSRGKGGKRAAGRSQPVRSAGAPGGKRGSSTGGRARSAMK